MPWDDAPDMSTPKTLLIVYHSMTDGTRQMAEAARAGACASAEDQVQARLLHAAQAGPADLLAADGYLFATPENLASMSGQLKDFFDRSYYAVLDQINGRPYSCLVCAGSDGQGAARQIGRIATGLRLKPIAEPLIVCTHAQTPEAILTTKRIHVDELQRCHALGEAMALGLKLGVF
jgi:NAD(P)H-dependent FMN reductase